MSNNEIDGEIVNEIVFDKNSGISKEEQQEILKQINGIAEKNRRSLSAGADDGGGEKGKKKNRRFKAKKSGGLFPVLVNVIAVLALAGGGFALYALQGKTDVQARKGTNFYNSAERLLIEEIRRETASRLENKESEIASISSRLEEVDAELRELHSDNVELTAEQRAAQARLQSLREEYSASLARLQDERSSLLEDARAKEAELQVQLQNRSRELAIVAERSSAAIEITRNELERQQSQAAVIEAQMAAFFANLHEQISENRLDDAAATVQSMRTFLHTIPFQALPSIQARRELYAQSINAFETMIEETRKNQIALSSGVMPLDRSAEALLAELQEKNARLEQDIAAAGSGANRRITELRADVTRLENANKTLENTNRTLTASSREKDSAIATLRQQNTERDSTIATLRQQNTERDNTINTLRQQNAEWDNTIATLRQQNTEKDSTIRDLRQQNDRQAASLSQIRSIMAGKVVTDMTLSELNDNLIRIQNALAGN